MLSLNKILTYVPVTLFLIIVVFNFVFARLDLPDSAYLKTYYNSNEIIGSPLIMNLFMLGCCYRYRFCYYNIVSVFGMILLNIVNLLAINTSIGESEYYEAVTQIIIAPVFALVIIFLIKKI